MHLKECVTLLVLTTALLTSIPTHAASTVWAWGFNDKGQCNLPLDLTNAVAVSAGRDHALALREDGTVVAWGDNSRGQCNVPASLRDVAAVAAGAWFSMALQSNGTVTAWGANDRGQCTVPSSLTNAVAVAAGFRGAMALTTQGSVLEWGVPPPGVMHLPMPLDLTNAISISVGYYHSVAVRADGSVSAWGDVQFGESGVDQITNVAQVSADYYSLVLLRNGKVTTNRFEFHYFGEDLIPTNLATVTGVAAGSGIAMALEADGTVTVWGSNAHGACDVPPGIERITSISAGGDGGETGFCLALSAPAAPMITRGPASQKVAVGSTATLSVSAQGAPPLSFQWFRGSESISGATQAALVLTNVQPADSGTYSVQVSNPYGVVSTNATITVAPYLDVSMVPAIKLTGGVGSTYRIEFSNALGDQETWQELAVVTVTNTPQLYFDTTAEDQPRRVYRAVQVP